MKRRAVVTFNILSTVVAICLAEVKAAHLTGNRETATFGVIELSTAQLRIPLTIQMSTKRYAALSRRDICRIQVWRLGIFGTSRCKQLANSSGHGAHLGWMREKVIKNFFIEVTALLREPR